MSRSTVAAFLSCCCLCVVGCENNKTKTTEGAASIDSTKACCAEGEKAGKSACHWLLRVAVDRVR